LHRFFRRVTLGTCVAIVSTAAGLGATGAATSAAPITASTTTAPSCPWLDETTETVPQKTAQIEAQATSAELASLMSAQGDGGTRGYYEANIPGIPSLCVPPLHEQDGDEGLRSVWGKPTSGDTQMPSAIDEAASFDPTLAWAYGQVLGTEAEEQGVEDFMGPMCDVGRTSFWGRTSETVAGEDPDLGADLCLSEVRGLEAGGAAMVTLKHPAGGTQERGRSTNGAQQAIIGTKAFHEEYLEPFEQTILNAPVLSIMCSHVSLGSTPACADTLLLDTILRDDWGFKGFVRTDCITPETVAGIQQSYENGLIAAGVNQTACDGTYLNMASEPISVLKALATPYLNALWYSGVMQHPDTNTPGTIPSPTQAAGVAVSTRTEEEGDVLLKNASGILPLNATEPVSLTVADNPSTDGIDTTQIQSAQGAQQVTDPPNSVDLSAALRALVGKRLAVTSSADTNAAVAAAKAAVAAHGVAMVVVSEDTSEFSDRQTLALLPAQTSLIDSLASATNGRLVVLINAGQAVLMPWLNQVQGVVQMWYPGQTSAGLAELLTGAANFSGKLPITFPTSDTAQPVSYPYSYGGCCQPNPTGPGTQGVIHYTDGVDVGYRWYESNKVTPLFPFGYGLSYSRFRYSNLSVSPPGTGGNITVTATVTNTSEVAGADVAQLYLGDPHNSDEAPRILRGFQRVQLAAGQSSPVTFTITPGDMSVWNSPKFAWDVIGGTYHVYVGDSSALANLPLEGTFAVPGLSTAAGLRGLTVTGATSAG
jgi:beta-glucosidase